jgi:hypothetical protein
MTADSAKRGNAVWRHVTGAARARDANVFREDSVLYNVGSSRSRSGPLRADRDAELHDVGVAHHPHRRAHRGPRLVAARRAASSTTWSPWTERSSSAPTRAGAQLPVVTRPRRRSRRRALARLAAASRLRVRRGRGRVPALRRRARAHRGHAPPARGRPGHRAMHTIALPESAYAVYPGANEECEAGGYRLTTLARHAEHRLRLRRGGARLELQQAHRGAHLRRVALRGAARDGPARDGHAGARLDPAAPRHGARRAQPAPPLRLRVVRRDHRARLPLGRVQPGGPRLRLRHRARARRAGDGARLVRRRARCSASATRSGLRGRGRVAGEGALHRARPARGQRGSAGGLLMGVVANERPTCSAPSSPTCPSWTSSTRCSTRRSRSPRRSGCSGATRR